MRRKRQRQPHPDPARELDLQRILDLRGSIDRRADLIGQYRKEIGKLHAIARAAALSTDRTAYLQQADALHHKIFAIEAAIEKTGAQIADLQAAMSPDDLAYLS